jgi:acyl-coenzyme A synthetase/AMP-(fatty) acid ligase
MYDYTKSLERSRRSRAAPTSPKRFSLDGRDYSAENVERMVRKYRPEFRETHPNHIRAWQHLVGTGAFESVRIFGTGFDVAHPDTVRTLLNGSPHGFAMYFEISGQNESGPVAIRMHIKGFRGLRRKKGRRVGRSSDRL